MKTKLLLLILLCTISISSLSAQVGVGTTLPKGALDVESPNSGMLIPRVQLTEFLVASPVLNPQTGVLVNGTLVYNVGPVLPDNMAAGFYYWDTTKWVALSGGSTPTNEWKITGNAGLTVANFLGTTDAADLYFRANNSNKFRIPSASNQILGYGGTSASPTYSWDSGTNYGMWLSGGTNIRFSTGGTSRFQIPNDFQVHAMSLGTATLPFYSWSADTNTGIFSPGADQVAIATNGTEKVRVLATGEVGIGTTAPKTKLEVTGALALNEGNALALANGANNNVSLGVLPYSLYRITGPTAVFTISGVVPIAGSNGQIVTIENTTANDMTIVHESVSTAANQILVPGATDLILKGQYATVTLQYNSTQLRWIVKSYAAGTVATSQSIYSVKGTTDTSVAADIIWADFSQMTLTVTPKNSTIYINFGASGYMDVGTFPRAAGVYFRIVNTNTNTTVAGVNSIATDFDEDYFGTRTVISAWNAHVTMFPVSVTPGTPVTFKVQWTKDGQVTNTVYNEAATSPDTDHRNLTIVDQF